MQDLDDTLNGGDFPVERIQDVIQFIGKWDIDLDLTLMNKQRRKETVR